MVANLWLNRLDVVYAICDSGNLLVTLCKRLNARYSMSTPAADRLFGGFLSDKTVRLT